jgi:hypothetical protein
MYHEVCRKILKFHWISAFRHHDEWNDLEKVGSIAFLKLGEVISASKNDTLSMQKAFTQK